MMNERGGAEPAPGEGKGGCARCGTCCRKEGPAFHRDDKDLIESGAIRLKDVLTIRKGELARDNVRGVLIPVSSDIIKIKGRKGSWTCLFFVDGENACAIYENRPLECRILNCRDTREFMDIYDKNRLTRKDLLADLGEMWEIVEDHEDRCSYDRIRALTGAVRAGGEGGEGELLHIIRYDYHIRDLMAKKGKMDPGMMDFLFGRPLSVTIDAFGLKLKPGGNGLEVLR